MSTHTTNTPQERIAFVGGGNIASAIIGGLIRQGQDPQHILVIEPMADARAQLLAKFGLSAKEVAGPELTQAELIVWAVKPQVFKTAAEQTRGFCAPSALHLSVAAGIPSDSIARWLGNERVVRAMPNTPALVGLGQTGLFARPAVTAEARARIEQVIATTGQSLWVPEERLLDAVTAVSGSGPAYVFFFIEAMVQAGVELGLTPEQAHQLAVGTFVGAAELARSSEESPIVLRERVTSKGGTTYAALNAMQASDVPAHIRAALHAACVRARELGEEFGR